MKCLLSALFSAFLLLVSVQAEEAATSPIDFLSLSIVDEKLTGAGADLLLADIENAQFIIIGEDHGFADSPELALALAKAARPFGVTNHVAEIGPLTDQWVSDILLEDGVNGLADALEGRSYAVPFLSLREDAELAAYFLNNARRGQDALWGVDQEFVGAPEILLPKLISLDCSEAGNAKLTSLLMAERAAFAAGEVNEIFLFAADDEIFGDLRAAYENCSGAGAIIDALEESANIYQLFATDNYGSNESRVELLRRQFLEALRSDRKKAPRALIKMGGYHAGRGTPPVNTFDIGSLTEGLAAANGLDVLRIAFFPLSGKQTAIQLSPGAPYVTGDQNSEDVAALLEAIGAGPGDLHEAGWTLIVLAPVRTLLGQKGMAALPRDMRFLVLGFDYLVTTADARAATPLGN